MSCPSLETSQRFLWAGCIFAAMAASAAPAAFSHNKHAPMNIACATCHVGALKAERAGFPEPRQCLVCHQRDGEGRAGLPSEVLDHIPSKRIYTLPDFVFFSHAKHGAAKVKCKSCHGDVTARGVLEEKRSFTMKSCVDCHRAKHAGIACTTCHELGQ